MARGKKNRSMGLLDSIERLALQIEVELKTRKYDKQKLQDLARISNDLQGQLILEGRQKASVLIHEMDQYARGLLQSGHRPNINTVESLLEVVDRVRYSFLQDFEPTDFNAKFPHPETPSPRYHGIHFPLGNFEIKEITQALEEKKGIFLLEETLDPTISEREIRSMAFFLDIETFGELLFSYPNWSDLPQDPHPMVISFVFSSKKDYAQLKEEFYSPLIQVLPTLEPNRGSSEAAFPLDGSARILVVEDDHLEQHLLENIYSEYGEVTTVSNLHQANQALTEAIETGKPFHLVSLDLYLGNHFSSGLVEDLRRKERAKGLPKCPIIVISQETDHNVILELATMDIGSYMIKPVLKTSLRRHLLKMGIVLPEKKT